MPQKRGSIHPELYGSPIEEDNPGQGTRFFGTSPAMNGRQDRASAAVKLHDPVATFQRRTAVADAVCLPHKIPLLSVAIVPI